MDHGSQYLSDHFTNQIKFWGIQPSYAFVEQPQTNGVAERLIAPSRNKSSMAASTATSRRCGTPSAASSNRTMLRIVEKNGYLSPAQARQAWDAAISLRPAAWDKLVSTEPGAIHWLGQGCAT